MAKKFAKYTLPKLEEALDTLANSVLTYATPHIEGASTGSATKTDGESVEPWTDVPMDKWTVFKDALAAWTPAYATCEGGRPFCGK
jgi:hypothetical protein